MTSSDGDTRRSSVRQLNLRDHLWRTFEVMSADQERSIDELVNDALAAYAQIAGYETTGSRDSPVSFGVPPGAGAVPATSPADEFKRRAAGGLGAGPAAGDPLHRLPSGVPPMPGPAATSLAGAASGPSHAPGSGHPPGPGRFGRPQSGPSAGPPQGAPSTSALQPRPSAGAPPQDGAASSAGSPLYLVFDHQKYRIDKDQFIIGRGTKSSDLPIKDGNISRKHAAVIRRNGTFFIKDLGSTNGIDFKGMRIDNKRIDEGDVFHICEYELKFTYKR